METESLQTETRACSPQRLFIWHGISVHTEMTNKTSGEARAGWLAYDAQCRFCVAMARRLESVLRRRGVEAVPLQAGWVRQRLGLRDGERADRMWLLRRDGVNFGGGDALIELARLVWWARPVAWLARVPGARRLINAGYMLVARNRSCLSGACSIARRHPPSAAFRPGDWLPLWIAVTAALAARSLLPAWAFMWVLAAAIFAGCKWWMYRRVARQQAMAGQPAPSAWRAAGYFFAWPGLDASAFLADDRTPVAAPDRRDWLGTGLNLMMGAGLVALARQVPANQPLLAGWIFMGGLIFLLHFGLMRALTLLCRHAGVNAPLMMENPAAATSLSEFWGRRWNRDFRVFAHQVVFQPAHRLLVRRRAACAAGGAMLAVFLFSGLVHDLVISVPARAGLGMPTGYFVLQAAGVWFERSATGRRIGLGRGLTGWLFVFALAAVPAFALFHPDFVVNVMVPFARAMGVVE